MAKLTASKRKKIPSAKFALPKERKYPIQDKSHAINAKARAEQMENKGVISTSTKNKIDKAANKVLKKDSVKKMTPKKITKKTTKRGKKS